MSTLPPILSLLLMVGVAASTVWILTETGRRLSVRGSRPRYVYASAERATRWPALFFLTMSSVLSFKFGDVTMGAAQAIGVALWITIWWERKRAGDDDEDFWTKTKQWLLTRAAGAAPSTSGA